MPDTLASLRDVVQGLREELRYLKDAIAPSSRVRYFGFRSSRAERAILIALVAADGPVSHTKLRLCMDVALDRRDAGSLISVDMAILHLRKKLAALDPPIVIRSERGLGFELDAANKELLAGRRVAGTGGAT